ncbi:alanine--tRNA ligase [Paracnuella aquatica]|uniref:alanine--tRNA ligase n=1 Tax=Paracnuella aquatica TaxID=2268757 RepID=UPI000DEED147|nr:alanine--tRNA ligase [Paracnuella aquatica]RPD48180.1 alanine--tRNA ligase [Paracnuella aquatica]
MTQNDISSSNLEGSNHSAADIRAAFLQFFRSKQHQIVPSAPIVVKNDPTLMFTNAGMNQFKDYFLGNKPAPSPRIADTQKCLRVSGKHNDLEEVGVDHYHHTMFEMLGNWSFGDYFKEEAIAWSWELLTSVLKIPVDRLYVTIFEGDEKEGLPRDEEAYTSWKKWIAEDRILLGNKKDNFWEMGDTGPCGPCTEIHVDTRPNVERLSVDGKTLVNNDHPEVIEIWNNVFIQFNRLKDGSLQPLPQKHVDTGMGFERLVRVLQGKASNYDTDVFSGLIDSISKTTGTPYTGSQSKADIAIRVNADHIRAITFTIADGQLPANTGAGYVIRRILRRAVRYYYSYLNYQQPLLHQLVPVLAAQLKDVFPELAQQEAFVARVIREEEEAFLRTLEKGLRRIEDIIALSGGLVGGKETFELYDTYGFPVDLTRLIASERGLTVDEPGFEREMQQQKDRSRAASATDAGDWVVLQEGGLPEFVGYNLLEASANVLRYRKVKAKGKEAFQVVLDRTPFYAESGGQVGDTGKLVAGSQELKVIDTKREGDLIVHFVDRIPEGFAGGEVRAEVDVAKRKATALHHSATHLLHAALRKVLGSHVAQKGSLVAADYLRFDFSHFSKMTAEEAAQVEVLVNAKIRENIPVAIRQMPKDEALKLGAMALFGEKYGDTVRVVTMDPEYSVELCGGTHVGATGELGFFKITSEAAVAAGVRRIEALCGAAAENFINEQLVQLAAAKEALNNPKDILKSIASLKEESAVLKKKIELAENEQLIQLRNELKSQAQPMGDAQFIGAVVSVGSADALKKLAFELKAAVPNPLVVLAADIAGKAQVVILLDEAQVAAKNLDAGALIKQTVAPLIKGGGGGQKSLATAGGQNVAQLADVIEAVRSQIAG